MIKDVWIVLEYEEYRLGLDALSDKIIDLRDSL